MDILSFDIAGKMAHFRKIHGNNTAMSYTIPPRTTIIGLLAALLGREKDSYYTEMQDSNLRIGLRTLGNHKKSFHRLNLLKINSKEDFTGKNGRVQTPFEVVTGTDIKHDDVSYRIYCGCADDSALFEELKSVLNPINPAFNLTLGGASFHAQISNARFFLAIEKQMAENEQILIHSACNSEQVEELLFSDDPTFKFNFIEEELLPADFLGGDKGREIFRMNRVLFATQNFEMDVMLKGEYYKLEKDNEIENIQFLDYADFLS